jgi:hypothetical protein
MLVLAVVVEAGGFRVVTLTDLELEGDADDLRSALDAHVMQPLSGWEPGVRCANEAYLAADPEQDRFSPQGKFRLALRQEDDAVTKGFVDLMLPGGTIREFAFSIDPAKVAESTEEDFRKIRAAHYARLSQAHLPGTAWFRVLSGLPPEEIPDFGSQRNIDQTFNLFSGSRAVAENLALDRALILGSNDPTDDAPVKVADIKGVSIRPIDWKEKLEGVDEVAIDPLALAIPADQHALFVPSTGALLDLLRLAGEDGMPLVQGLNVRNPFRTLVQRYRGQMGLDIPDLIARQLPVRGLAVTGGDPFFPSGSDVAVLFDAEKPAALYQTLLTLIRTKAAGHEATTAESEGDGWRGASFTTRDRSFSCHLLHAGDWVAVANSKAQIDRLLAVRRGEAEALGAIDEFRFFRHRYRLDAGESAFVFLSDAAIRRWCGPELRIGASRRTRAAAALMALTARMQDGGEPGDEFAPLLGGIESRNGRLISAVHGSLGFMTPIAELGIDTVTTAERLSYERWREGYENGWPVVFDPIAIRLDIAKARRAMDMTVLPLTSNSDYLKWIGLAGKSRLSPRARAVPEKASMFLSFAVDPDAEVFRSFDQQMLEMLPDLKIQPLGWMAGSVSLWLDEGMDLGFLAGRQWSSEAVAVLPLVARIESKSPVKLALFLTALKSLAESSAPDLLTWETRRHAGQAYVSIHGDDESISGVSLHYAAMRGALLVSLDEPSLIRAIGREQAELPAGLAEALPKAHHLFGEASPATLSALRTAATSRDALNRLQWESWKALPVLNEWKRRHPDKDPAALELARFASDIHCPGGRGYQWNAKAMTMESVALGHPAAPRADGLQDSPLARWPALRAAIDFADGGLRLRASMGPVEARLPNAPAHEGELLGKAADYVLTDPKRMLVFRYTELEENSDGEWVRVDKTSTEKVEEITRKGDSLSWVANAIEDGEKSSYHYILDGDWRLARMISDEHSAEFPQGFLELPGELRAGALREDTVRLSETHEGETMEGTHRLLVRIVGKERVETPAGVFEDCLKVEKTHHYFYDDGSSYSNRTLVWYHPGLGLVKAEDYSDGEVDTSILIENRLEE